MKTSISYVVLEVCITLVPVVSKNVCRKLK